MGALDGKVAIVTGATSGIGERIAEVFIAEGAKVVTTGRRESEGKALMERMGGNGRFLRADVSSEDGVKNLINHTVEVFGGLDIIVNNAGMSAQVVPIADMDMAHFDQVMGINIRGVVMWYEVRGSGNAEEGQRQHHQRIEYRRIARRIHRPSLWHIERRSPCLYALGLQ